jgi:phospholipase C
MSHSFAFRRAGRCQQDHAGRQDSLIGRTRQAQHDPIAGPYHHYMRRHLPPASASGPPSSASPLPTSPAPSPGPRASLARVLAATCAGLLAAGTLAACTASSTSSAAKDVVPPGIHKIKHVIIVMQENRSFDSYFGTYPGADGIPMSNGVPTVCVPNPAGGCTRPYHDTADVNGGGPHAKANAIADINGGKMDGFIKEWEGAKSTCQNPEDPACTNTPTPDVMGYHTGAEIPNYWTYAKDFVLDDHMYEAVKSWSLPEHLYMVSAWSAKCKNRNPMSCVNNIAGPYNGAKFDQAVHQELTTGQTDIDLAWTDITWLLYEHHVSWAYYVQAGAQPDCANDADETCTPVAQNAQTPGIWNPLPLFTDVQDDHQLSNIQSLGDYYAAAKKGTLPAVSWITPSQPDSEHPPASVHQGQAYVTSVINAAMESPDWDSTAIFLAWDDWGGFYDNVPPPYVDRNGYGLRVPSLVISPYAKRGYIDHQTLSSDAYLKFIEDDFLDSARLDPATDGRPDPRPDVREDEPLLGSLVQDFDFSQAPRPPLLLPTNPPTDSPSIPGYFTGKPACVGCTTPPPALVKGAKKPTAGSTDDG